MLPPRIAFAQRIDIKKCMRDIAPAATGNFYFGKKFGCFFKKNNTQVFVQPGCREGTEKTRRTTSYHYQLFQNPILFGKSERHLNFVIGKQIWVRFFSR